MYCLAYRDPRRELFTTLKKETNLILDSMTPSSDFINVDKYEARRENAKNCG